MRAALKRINLVVLAVITVIAVTISVGDFFKLIPDNSKNYPLITLLLLASVGLHLVTTNLKTEEFETGALELLNNLEQGRGTVSVKVFDDSSEIENYLGKRILEATKSVCDLSWKQQISAGFSASGRQLAHTYMDNCIAMTSGRIPYREIFVFNDPRRIDKLNRRLDENKDGYSCRHFRDGEIPRMQFVIVDDTEVFFFASAADSILCSVKNAEIARVFRSYYDAAWAKAKPLKDGPTVHHSEVQKVLRLLDAGGKG